MSIVEWWITSETLEKAELMHNSHYASNQFQEVASKMNIIQLGGDVFSNLT